MVGFETSPDDGDMNTLETIVGLNTVCAGPTPLPTQRESKNSWNLGPSPSFPPFGPNGFLVPPPGSVYDEHEDGDEPEDQKED